MNIKLGLNYVFKDEHWFKKITRLALHQLLPISGQAILAGWSLKIAKNVIEGIDEPLPELTFAEDKQRGFSEMEITFVYSIPFFMLTYFFIWLSSACMNLVGFSAFNSNTLSIFQSIFVVILAALFSLFAQIGIMHYLTEDDLKAAFKLKEIWELFINNPGDWLLVILFIPLLGIILAPLGLLAFIVGIFFIMTYLSTVGSHLSGQAYRNSLQKVHLLENTPD